MEYKKNNKKQNRRRNGKASLPGLCGLFCFLLIAAGMLRLWADLREGDGLSGRNGEAEAEYAEVCELGVVKDAGMTGISGTGAVPGEWTGENTQNRGKAQDLREGSEEDYAEKCGLDSVDPPKKRTTREVLRRLERLGEDSTLIAEILQNRSDYPDKLLEALANNPEMADFVSRWRGLQDTAQSGLTKSEKEQEFPLFLQWDPRWGYVEYGDESCIGLAGCGPTCLSMVLYYLTGDESITPDRVGEYSMENGCYIPGTGTAWVLMESMPLEYGISVRQPAVSENTMKAALDEGAVLILSMGPGDFTAAGHFIVVYGYDKDGFLVNDPNCVARSRVQWTYEEIERQIKHMWVFSEGGMESGNYIEYYDFITN